MAIKFETLKNHVLVVLYDYMLTSDADTCWFSAQDIADGLPEDVSGAFLARALVSLSEYHHIEEGLGDPDGQSRDTKLYSLQEGGIEEAESVLVKLGWDLADYQPAPSSDRIISRAEEPAVHSEISNTIALITKSVEESNEVGDRLGEDRDFVVDELSAARALSSKDKFRLRGLRGLILPALRFLASKFIGEGLGETAKRLVELLLKVS